MDLAAETDEITPTENADAEEDVNDDPPRFPISIDKTIRGVLMNNPDGKAILSIVL